MCREREAPRHTNYATDAISFKNSSNNLLSLDTVTEPVHTATHTKSGLSPRKKRATNSEERDGIIN